MRDLEFTSVYVGSGLETSDYICLDFPSSQQADTTHVAHAK